MMKSKHLLYLTAALAITGCNKAYDVNDLLPSVDIVSAEPTPEGTIIVTGRIINAGEGELIMLGFCADSTGYPRIHENQTLVYAYAGNEFTGTVYPHGAQTQDNRIYINAFAGNNVGLGKGTPIEVTQLDAFYDYPQMMPPCRLDYDHYYLDDNPTSFTTVSNISSSSLWAYSVSASDGAGTIMNLTFSFHESPAYTLTTETITFGSQGKIKGIVTNDGQNWTLVGHPEITFSKIADNRFVITICNAYLGSLSGAKFDCQIIAEM